MESQSEAVTGNPMTDREKLDWCIRALDGIACDYEWMKRKDMIERAGRTLCDIGVWRKVSPGEFARHGQVLSGSAGIPADQSDTGIPASHTDKVKLFGQMRYNSKV